MSLADDAIVYLATTLMPAAFPTANIKGEFEPPYDVSDEHLKAMAIRIWSASTLMQREDWSQYTTLISITIQLSKYLATQEEMRQFVELAIQALQSDNSLGDNFVDIQSQQASIELQRIVDDGRIIAVGTIVIEVLSWQT